MADVPHSSHSSTSADVHLTCTCWSHEGRRIGWTEGWPCPVHPSDHVGREDGRGEGWGEGMLCNGVCGGSDDCEGCRVD